MDMSFAQLSNIDVGVILVYLVLMIIAGIAFARYMKNAKDLFAAGGNVPWWVAGISSYMSFFSGGTFVAWGSIAYCFGWVSISIQWVVAIAAVIVTVFFAKRWKRIGIDSPIQFLEKRFSPSVRQLYAWIRVPYGVLTAALCVYAVSVLINEQVGLNLNTVIVIIMAVLLIYSVLGGLWAVLTTDVLQFFVLTFVTFLMLPLVLKSVGGIGNFIENSPEGFFNLVQNPKSFLEPSKVKFTSSYFLWWTILQIFNIGTMWEFIQRFQSCRTEKDARKSGFLVSGLFVIMPIFWLVPMMAYRLIDPSYYDVSTPLVTKTAEPVYIFICRDLLPKGLTGLALAAMMSATGSMVNSILNVNAAVVTRDLYARLLRKKASEKELVMAGRAILLVLGMGIAVIACQINKWGGIVNYFFTIVAIVAGPLAVPFLLAIVFQSINSRTVWAAVTIGIASGIGLQFILPMLLDFEATLSIKLLASTGVPLLVLLAGKYIIAPATPEKQKVVDLFFQKIKNPLPSSAKHITADYRPIALIGVLIAVLGLIMLQLLWFVKEQRLLIVIFCSGMILFGYLLWRFNRLGAKKT